MSVKGACWAHGGASGFTLRVCNFLTARDLKLETCWYLKITYIEYFDLNVKKLKGEFEILSNSVE